MRYFQRMILSTSVSTIILLLSNAAVGQGSADTYPSKPVMVIVPFAAGGPVDLEARLYLPKMGALMGQSFVVDYKLGAASMTGSGYVAKARADGYTLLVHSAGLTVFPAFYKDLSFDVVKDFSPVSVMSERFSVLMVRASFPAKTLAEYIAYAKANPRKINYGTAGVGELSHLAGALLHSITNTTVTFVPFKGTGPILQELAAGRLDVSSGGLILAVPLIKSGKVHPIAILNNNRNDLFPGVPTVVEQGVPGYTFSNWLGFLAPGATPTAIVNKLSEGFARVAGDPDIVATLRAQGSLHVGSTPTQFRQIIIADIARWEAVVKEAGIRLE